MALCIGGCGATVFFPTVKCTNCTARDMKGGLRTAVVPPKAVAQTLAAGALPGGAVLELKCRGKGQMAWADVADTSTLFILKGSEVEFKADSTGGSPALRTQIQYTSAQWAGTLPGGAAGGATKRHTFTTNSAAKGSPWTLTLTFGGQTVTVNLVVYTLNVVSRPRDPFAGRSQTDLGVDERVELEFTTTPVGVTAAEAGGLLWRPAGVGGVAARDTTGLLQNATTHTGPPANDGKADYIAPYQTHGVGQQIQPSREVTLQLSVVGGPSAGRGPEQKYRVHKPQAHMTRVPGSQLHHLIDAGTDVPSAGFTGRIYFAPKTVSFRTLRFRENAGVIEDTLAGDENGTVHTPTDLSDPTVGVIGSGNSATGCLMNGDDNVHSAGDEFQIVSSGSPTTKVGHKKWPIQWEYTYAALDPTHPDGVPALAWTPTWLNVWILMQLAHHIFTQYQNGRSTIFKGHVGCEECVKPIEVLMGAPHHWP